MSRHLYEPVQLSSGQVEELMALDWREPAARQRSTGAPLYCVTVNAKSREVVFSDEPPEASEG